MTPDEFKKRCRTVARFANKLDDAEEADYPKLVVSKLAARAIKTGDDAWSHFANENYKLASLALSSMWCVIFFRAAQTSVDGVVDLEPLYHGIGMCGMVDAVLDALGAPEETRSEENPDGYSRDWLRFLIQDLVDAFQTPDVLHTGLGMVILLAAAEQAGYLKGGS